MKIKNILISQNAPADFEKSPYAELKKKYSINIDFYKFFKIEHVDAITFRKSKVSILEHEAVIFSSKNAVDHFFELCKEMRITIPETMKYLCTTEAIAFYLQKYIQYRKRRIFASKDSTTENFRDLLLKNKELNMLIPCGQNGYNQEMKDFMRENDIKFDEAVVFTTCHADLAHDIDISKYDLIALFSPNGVKSLQANFPDFQQEELAFAALGSSVVDALTECGWTAQVVAPTPKYPSITDAMDAFLKEYATRRR